MPGVKAKQRRDYQHNRNLYTYIPYTVIWTSHVVSWFVITRLWTPKWRSICCVKPANFSWTLAFLDVLLYGEVMFSGHRRAGKWIPWYYLLGMVGQIKNVRFWWLSISGVSCSKLQCVNVTKMPDLVCCVQSPY